MYHSISGDREENVHPYYRVNTSPERFEEHLQFLHENQYTVVSLGEAVKRLRENSSQWIVEKGKRSVVITFDDGFADFYTYAFPLLRKYGFTATVFLPTGLIDGNSNGIGCKEHLSWEKVVELYGKGIEFGSHSVSHPLLREKNRVELEFELSRSKKDIEEKIGATVAAFSFPYAFPEEDKTFVSLLKDTLSRSGYKICVSTMLGTNSSIDDVFSLKRIPINSLDDIIFFEAKLNGGYDWLGKPQYLIKVLKKAMKRVNFKPEV